MSITESSRNFKDSSIMFLLKDQIKFKSTFKLIFSDYRTTYTCKADKAQI